MEVLNSTFTDNGRREDNIASGYAYGTIYNEGTANIRNSLFTENNMGAGGALYNKGIMNIYDSTFAGNISRTGGAINADGSDSTLTIYNSTFTANSGSNNGAAAIRSSNANVYIYDSVFEDHYEVNTSLNPGDPYYDRENGAVIYHYDPGYARDEEGNITGFLSDPGVLYIEDTIFRNNTVGRGGGAIYTAGQAILNNVTFENNASDLTHGPAGTAGAFYNYNRLGYFYDDRNSIIRNSTFRNNSAYSAGAIYHAIGTLEVYDTLFDGNKGIIGGIAGGLYGSADSTLLVDNSTFINNFSGLGAAIGSGRGAIYITDSHFENNTAHTTGSAIHMRYSTPNEGDSLLHGVLSVDNTDFINNTASSGTVYLEAHTEFEIKNSSFIENIGGGLVSYGNGKVSNTLFSGNEGGSIVNRRDASLIVENSTFENGTSNAISNSGYIEIYNSLITGHTAGNTSANYTYSAGFNNNQDGTGAVVKNTVFTNNITQHTNSMIPYQGGAIYSRHNLDLVADDGKMLFSGNLSNQNPNAIVSSGSDLNLFASDTGSFIINDSIVLRVDSVININNTSNTKNYATNGVIELNDTLMGSGAWNSRFDANLYDGTLKFGTATVNYDLDVDGIAETEITSSGTIHSNINFNVYGGEISTVDSEIKTTNLGNLNLHTDVNWNLDVDLESETADRLTANSVVENDNSILINELNVLSVGAEDLNVRVTADADLMDVIKLGLGRFTINEGLLADAKNFSAASYDNTTGYLNILHKDEVLTLKSMIDDSGSDKVYVMSKAEEVAENLGDLQGTRLNITANNNVILGNGFAGVNIGQNQELSAYDVSRFNGFISENGGAINNFGFVHLENSSFIGNSANLLGGALYNAQNAQIDILAENKDVLFENNTILLNNVAQSQAIYNLGTINLYSSLDNAIISYDTFAGRGEYNLYGNLNLKGQNSGFGSDSNLNIIGENARISLLDNEINNVSLGNLNSPDGLKLSVDADIAKNQIDEVMGNINQDSILVDEINMLSSIDANSEERSANLTLDDDYSLDVNTLEITENFENVDRYIVLDYNEIQKELSLFESSAGTLKAAFALNQAHKGFYLDDLATIGASKETFNLQGTSLTILGDAKTDLNLSSSSLALSAGQKLILTDIANVYNGNNNLLISGNADLSIRYQAIDSASYKGDLVEIGKIEILGGNTTFNGLVDAEEITASSSNIFFNENVEATSIQTEGASQLYFGTAENSQSIAQIGDIIQTDTAAGDTSLTVGNAQIALSNSIDIDGSIVLNAENASSVINFTSADSWIGGNANIDIFSNASFNGVEEGLKKSTIYNNIEIAENGALASSVSFRNIALEGFVQSFENINQEISFENVDFNASSSLADINTAGIVNINEGMKVLSIANTGTVNINNATSLYKADGGTFNVADNVRVDIAANGGFGTSEAQTKLVSTNALFAANSGFAGDLTNLGVLANNFYAKLFIDAKLDLDNPINNTYDQFTVSGLEGLASFSLAQINLVDFIAGTKDSNGVLDIFVGENSDAIALNTSNLEGLKVFGADYDISYVANLETAFDLNDFTYIFDLYSDDSSNNTLNKILNTIDSPRQYIMEADEEAGIASVQGDMTVLGNGNSITAGTISLLDSANNSLTLNDTHIQSGTIINLDATSAENKNILNLNASDGKTIVSDAKIIGLAQEYNQVNIAGEGTHIVRGSLEKTTLNIATETMLEADVANSTLNVAANTEASNLDSKSTVNVLANVDDVTSTEYTTKANFAGTINLFEANANESNLNNSYNAFVIDSSESAITTKAIINSSSQENKVILTGSKNQRLNSKLNNVTLDINSTGKNILRGTIDNSILNINEETTAQKQISNSVLNVDAKSTVANVSNSKLNLKSSLTASGSLENSAIDILSDNIILDSVINNSTIDIKAQNASFIKAIDGTSINLLDGEYSAVMNNISLDEFITINLYGADNTNTNVFTINSNSTQLTTDASIHSANKENVIDLTGIGGHLLTSDLADLTLHAHAKTKVSGILNNVNIEASKDITFDNINIDESVALSLHAANAFVVSNEVLTHAANFNALGNSEISFTGSGSHILDKASFDGLDINVATNMQINEADFNNSSLLVAANKSLTNAGIINGGQINLLGKNSKFVLEKDAQLSSSTDVSLASKSIFDTQNNAIDTVELNSLTATRGSKLHLDVDLNTKTIDSFNVQNSSGRITLDSINLLSEVQDQAKTKGTLQIFSPSSLDIDLTAITYYSPTKKIILSSNKDNNGSIDYSVKNRSTETISSVSSNNTNTSNTIYEVIANEILSVAEALKGKLTFKGLGQSITGLGYTGADDSHISFEDLALLAVETITLGQNKDENSTLSFDNANNDEAMVITSDIFSLNPQNIVSFGVGVFKLFGILDPLTVDVSPFSDIQRENVDSVIAYNLEGKLSYADDKYLYDPKLVGTNVGLALYGRNSINFMGGRLSLVNNVASPNLLLDNLTLANNSTSYIGLDVDLELKSIDALQASTIAVGTGAKLLVDEFNIVKDALDSTPITLDFTNNASLQAALGIAAEHIVSYSPIYEYDILYNAGSFTFTRDSKNFNPEVLTSLVATQNYVNTVTDVAKKALDPKNVIEISSGLPAGSENSSKLLGSAWLDVYGSFENNEFYGMNVDNEQYGFIAGLSTAELSLGSFDSIYSLYVGSINSKQEYKDIEIDQNGFVVGASAMFEKGIFSNKTTANFAASFAESTSNTGKEGFDTYSFSIFNKTALTLEMNEGFFILQPALTLGYSYIQSEDYQNASQIEIKSDAWNIFTINPEIKASFNFDNGIKPYLSAGYHFNIDDNSRITANALHLPDLQSDSYAEFKAGVDAQFTDSFAGYAELSATLGDRESLAGQIGFKYSF